MTSAVEIECGRKGTEIILHKWNVRRMMKPAEITARMCVVPCICTSRRTK